MAKKEDLKSAGTADRIYKDVSEVAALMNEGDEKEVSRNEKYRESLMRQIREFYNDDSVLEKYRNDIILGRYVLVRVFKFKGKDVMSRKIILPGGKLPGMGKSPVKVEDVIYDNKVLALGKVLQIGDEVESKKLSIGQLVQLPTEEVEGMAQNPDYLLYLQMKDAHGANPNFDPNDIPKEIPKIQKEWLRYQYKHWLNIDVEDDDTLTYLLPESKIQSIKSIEDVVG